MPRCVQCALLMARFLSTQQLYSRHSPLPPPVSADKLCYCHALQEGSEYADISFIRSTQHLICLFVYACCHWVHEHVPKHSPSPPLHPSFPPPPPSSPPCHLPFQQTFSPSQPTYALLIFEASERGALIICIHERTCVQVRIRFC